MVENHEILDEIENDDVIMEEAEPNSPRELLPLKKFGFPAVGENFVEAERKNRTKVFCKLGNTAFPYKGNTTNMISHLSYCHKEEYETVKQANCR